MADSKDLTFINEIPSTTKDILKLAFGIYATLEARIIKVRVKEKLTLTEEKTIELNKIDKQVISMFLACIEKSSDVKDILNLEGTSSLDVHKFLNVMNIQPWTISDSTFEEYCLEFQNLIKRMANIPLDNINEFFPLKLFYNLLKRGKTGSDILKYFYQSIEKDDRNTYYSARKLWFDKKTTMHDEILKELQEPLWKSSTLSFNKKPKFESSLIEKYGVFLNDKNYLEMPAIKRDEEIKRLMIALLTDASALLVGEPGVGKTAVVEGLAYYIKNDMVPRQFLNKKIVKINIASILQGTTYRGDFEEKVETLMQELKNNPNIILFIDEIHNVIGAGSNERTGLDFANMLKPYLDRGEIKIIGATTTLEYEDYILSDGAFRRRFERIDVDEPDLEDVVSIVECSLINYCSKYQISFLSDNDLASSVIDLLVSETKLESRNMDDIINNPALILKLIDQIFAYATFNLHKEVLMSDVIEAVKAFSLLNSASKERLIYNLNKFVNNPNLLGKSKIIEFQSYRKSHH